MEDRETPRMHKYGESKTTQIMMATVRHVTSSSGLRKFQADGFLFNWVYMLWGESLYFYLVYAEYWMVPVDIIYNWSVSPYLWQRMYFVSSL